MMGIIAAYPLDDQPPGAPDNRGNGDHFEERAAALMSQLGLDVTANQRRAIARALMDAYSDGVNLAYEDPATAIDMAMRVLHQRGRAKGRHDARAAIATYILRRQEVGLKGDIPAADLWAFVNDGGSHGS